MATTDAATDSCTDELRCVKICQCKRVCRGAIEDAVRRHGLTDVDGVKTHTGAATACRFCTSAVARILLDLNGAAPPLRQVA